MDSLRNYDECSNHSDSSLNSEKSDHRSRREPKHPYGIIYFHDEGTLALENLGHLKIPLEDCLEGKIVNAGWKDGSGPHKATLIKVARKEHDLRETMDKKVKELKEGRLNLHEVVEPIGVSSFYKPTSVKKSLVPSAAVTKSNVNSKSDNPKRGRPKGTTTNKQLTVDKDPYGLQHLLQPPVNSAPDVNDQVIPLNSVPSTSREAGGIEQTTPTSNSARRTALVPATPTGRVQTVTTPAASHITQRDQLSSTLNAEQSAVRMSRNHQELTRESDSSPKVAKNVKKVELVSHSGVYVTNQLLRQIQSETFLEKERLRLPAPDSEASPPKKRKILMTFADKQFKKILENVMENDLLNYTHSGRQGGEAVDQNIVRTIEFYVRGNEVGPFSRLLSTLYLEAKRDFKKKTIYNTPEAKAKREAAKAKKAAEKAMKEAEMERNFRANSGQETSNSDSVASVENPMPNHTVTLTASIQTDALAPPQPSSSQQQERLPQFHRAWANGTPPPPTLSPLTNSAPGVIQSAMDLLYSGANYK